VLGYDKVPLTSASLKISDLSHCHNMNEKTRILCNQRDATYALFFIIISALHVSGGFSAHHQELIKLYVQPWVLSCFPAVYRRKA
jgi:hypothetical protein